MPVRIQRKREKGWRLPENTVCVTRGTHYGNPFKIGTLQPHPLEYLGMVYVESNQHATVLFDNWLDCAPVGKELLKRIKRELPGKNVACFCHPEDYCHGDIILRRANRTYYGRG